MLALLLALNGLAAEPPPLEGETLSMSAMPLRDPLPVSGDPWDLRLLRWALPRQDPAWFTSTDPYHTCILSVTAQPGEERRVEVVECPEPMEGDMRRALSLWDWEPADPAEAEGPSTFQVRFVARYSQELQTMTAHASVDPGLDAALDGVAGVPGLKLIHPAELRRGRLPRPPRKVRREYDEVEPCTVPLFVSARGRVVDPDVSACPEPVRERVIKTLGRWRYHPLLVDGVPRVEERDVVVEFR